MVYAGNRAAVLKATRSAFFSSTVGLVRPKARDKWLTVSHDAGSALIHDVIVHTCTVLTAMLHLIVNMGA